MRYRSTRGGDLTSLAEAVVRGLAPDGGLYLPAEIPALTAELLQHRPRPLAEVAEGVLAPYLDEIPTPARRALLAAALDFPIPLVEVTPGRHLLELFHGPTLAFKDVGARVLARLLAHFRGDERRPVTVLVATSGDTGGAVADAFHGVAGTRVAVLYPRGQVSALQERQMATLGGNVTAFAVDGTFDDCQRMVKEAFADVDLVRDLALTSANSINIGRLLPQIVYYVHGLAQLPPAAPPPVVVVPSGNLGNVTAGLLARRMGLEMASLVAATNANDAFPEYLATGRARPRPSLRTIANAMDVGAPSNLERLRALTGDDVAALRRELQATPHDDDTIRHTVRNVHDRHGVLLDPHTAVGWSALDHLAPPPTVPGIVLATAHPAKFGRELTPLVGEIELPESLRRCLDREVQSVPLAARTEELAKSLRQPSRNHVTS